MTQKDIEKFLADTKVYVAGKSKEIQEKLFLLGYKWNDGEKGIFWTDMPFLYIDREKKISVGSNMDDFIKLEFKEITSDEILSLELTEPTYRPFKDREECWNEMLKHHPFGWIKNAENEDYYQMGNVYNKIDFKDLLQIYRFADNTPFGIKED